ncbi:hypothetical protein GPECTOR_14g5 [Gonium pectorale]|uniref:Ribosome-binding factor A n=1 Tax=Gonium pectorale TaxID=33097 RepID=A0A150GMP0_GONPE|nr:hypothetical protein GPECTOR_14g5 [Gonium pectorale]|eukprot:KXZ51064.1 hypothetical protein GPECTOR_14g5 [Gonium pectorale]
MFVSDPVIQAAICPERRLGDDTLSAVASITNTYVSNDLQVVKVYVSVYSDDYGKRVAMENLQRLEPYVRRLIGQRVRLRLTPEVRFVYDDSEEEADLVARVIGREEVERYRSEIEAEMAGTSGQRDADQEGEDEGADEDGDEVDDVAYEDEDEYEDPDEKPQALPDPFGDLFVGEGRDEVRSRDGARPQGSYKKRTQGRRGKRGAIETGSS